MNDIIPPVTLEVQNVMTFTKVDIQVAKSSAQMTIEEYLATLKEHNDGQESR